MKSETSPEDYQLRGQVLEALETADTDFRTLQQLCEQFNVDEQTMRQTLTAMGSSVRRAISFSEQYDDWYRLSSKGLTRGEKRAHRKALITFQSLRNTDF